MTMNEPDAPAPEREIDPAPAVTRVADLDAAATAQFAALFHALSDPTRLMLLQHLSTGPHRVRDLVDHLDLAQSTVSTHLACLRQHGLVDCVAQGRASVFSLAASSELAGLMTEAQRVLEVTGTPATLCDHLMRGGQQEVS